MGFSSFHSAITGYIIASLNKFVKKNIPVLVYAIYVTVQNLFQIRFQLLCKTENRKNLFFFDLLFTAFPL